MRSNRAFTLVELLVAVAIGTLVSLFSVTSYYTLQESQEKLRLENRIIETFKKLDAEIANGGITSYSAKFVPGKTGAFIEVDFYGMERAISVNSFDWLTGTGNIISANTQQTGFFLMKDTKVVKEGTLSGSDLMKIEMTPILPYSWEVRGGNGEVQKNGFRLLYFDFDSTLPLSQQTVFVGFSGSTGTGGELINIRGNKSVSIGGDVATSLAAPVYLQFERKGVVVPIMIR